jgi:hypothetical protein
MLHTSAHFRAAPSETRKDSRVVHRPTLPCAAGGGARRPPTLSAQSIRAVAAGFVLGPPGAVEHVTSGRRREQVRRMADAPRALALPHSHRSVHYSGRSSSGSPNSRPAAADHTSGATSTLPMLHGVVS